MNPEPTFPASVPETDYPDRFFVVFLSLFKCRDSKLENNRSVSHNLNLIIHWASYHSILYYLRWQGR
jgi:hypothetical protein